MKINNGIFYIFKTLTEKIKPSQDVRGNLLKVVFLISALAVFSGCGAILENTLLYSASGGWRYLYGDSQGFMIVISPATFHLKEEAKTACFRAADTYSRGMLKKMVPLEFTWTPPNDVSREYIYPSVSHLGVGELKFRMMNPKDPNINNPNVLPVDLRETESYR